MGLDGVEIVMAVEEAFDISIEDADAEKLLTPRQLIDLVQSKVAGATASVCLTQRAFNLLRKSLRRHGGWKRSEITPARRLSELINRNQRRLLLENVCGDLSIKKPPKLVLANWLNITVLAGALGSGIFRCHLDIYSRRYVYCWCRLAPDQASVQGISSQFADRRRPRSLGDDAQG